MTSHDNIADDRWDTSVSFIFGVRNVCTYCGDPGNELDHVVPWSMLSAVVRKGTGGRSQGVRTWCCRECNGILSNKRFPCMWRRVVHVNDRLRGRLDRDLDFPIWSREDMKSLRPNLRRQIEARNILTLSARARVGWIFTPMCLGIMEDVRRRVCDESNPEYRENVARFFAPGVPPNVEGSP